MIFRLFIVCHPTPPPIYALKDVFGRFGNLIDIYMLSGKTFGYAKFASKESADKAIMVCLWIKFCNEWNIENNVCLVYKKVKFFVIFIGQ